MAQLWETNSDAISQSGLVGDETGTIKFVKWVKADLPNLEEGKSYRLRNLVTDEFQGRFSVKLNRTSQIEPLDVDVEVGSQAAEFSGALVDVQKGSGLIKRCPVCKRSLAKGVCSDHGKVEGTYDLRIKAVIDDGRRVQDVLHQPRDHGTSGGPDAGRCQADGYGGSGSRGSAQPDREQADGSILSASPDQESIAIFWWRP